ncbi:adhesin transport system outer membrane protein [Loktanella ponticola]|uniref:Adhesin transport system outer membrane protein n=1 Tax=Yoonia ponticola TaxID=1524255 RepID=A0A7W9EXY6_9RHOB|nr:TolC family protein [Yoonia ponticola]MBB5722213.1 adhesin transport system outer membrane protein [Yoonia ponticola]
MDGDAGVSRSNTFTNATEGEAVASPQAALDANLQDGSQSQIIEGLLNRRSVLGTGSYDQVADAVLAANARAAEADLRAATLRSEAQASNWLPTLGPNISLSSLGDVVTELVVQQVLFDNGKKRAERAYARADVEVAAVALAQDTNQRVLGGLELYLNAEAGKARAHVNSAAMQQMERYEYVMSERVRGGVSSRVDHQIVQQKLNAMQSAMSSDLESAASAFAELNAMSVTPLDGVTGLSTIGQPGPGAQPLTVMKAEAEAQRSMAEATVARAGFLPSLTASGSVGSEGSGGGLNVGADNGFGFGTGASLDALEASQAAANARVGQVRENANRSLESLRAELSSLRRQEAQAQTLAAQAASNFSIFSEQQRSGHRSVTEVVSILETKVSTEREAVALKYEVARTELKIAALMGSLVNGEQI